MDGMAMIKEQAPYLSAGNDHGDMEMEDEFMVVPEDQFSSNTLDEFLLEQNFAGLTGTILSPPNVDHVHQFCTIDGVAGRQPAQSNVQGFLFDQPHQHQESFLQQHQLFNDESNFPNPTLAETTDASQYFDDNFDFDGDQQPGAQPVQEEAVVFEGVAWEGEAMGLAQAQIGMLEDPGATWLAESADLNLIEQMASENDQHCQLLDELLRDDHVFMDAESSSAIDEDEVTGSDDTEASMASEILNEIYREAQQIDFAGVSSVSTASSMELRPTASSMELRPTRHEADDPRLKASPHFHLVDHDFGSARRGRPPGGSSRKRGTSKRDLKNKKQHQNREAALRYRLKKKAEKMEMETELQQLEKRNQFLKTEVHTLTAELKYMRDLFVEFRKVRGVK